MTPRELLSTASRIVGLWFVVHGVLGAVQMIFHGAFLELFSTAEAEWKSSGLLSAAAIAAGWILVTALAARILLRGSEGVASLLDKSAAVATAGEGSWREPFFLASLRLLGLSLVLWLLPDLAETAVRLGTGPDSLSGLQLATGGLQALFALYLLSGGRLLVRPAFPQRPAAGM